MCWNGFLHGSCRAIMSYSSICLSTRKLAITFSRDLLMLYCSMESVFVSNITAVLPCRYLEWLGSAYSLCLELRVFGSCAHISPSFILRWHPVCSALSERGRVFRSLPGWDWQWNHCLTGFPWPRGIFPFFATSPTFGLPNAACSQCSL